MPFINKIHITGFKAFPNDFELQLEGKHLLMYGENGSGKSSIYYALHCMFQSPLKSDVGKKYFNVKNDDGTPNEQHLKNLNNLDVDSLVWIDFNDRHPFIYLLDKNGYHATYVNGQHPLPANINGCFINHQFLFHFFNFRNSQKINLFPVFIKDILPFCKDDASGFHIGEMYDELTYSIIKKGNRVDERYLNNIKAFNESVKIVVENINLYASDLYKNYFMDDSHQPYMRNSDSYIEEAEHYIKQHKYEIAGNFLRKAAEAFCKSFLPLKKQLSADYSRLDLNGMIVNSKDFAIASGMTNIQLFEKLDEHRKFILNPSSHDSYDVEKYLYELKRCLDTLKELDKINIRPFMKKGTKLEFTLKTPSPQIDEYRFEIVLCDDFKVIELSGEMPIITKGMINYKVFKNGIAGKIQSDNTTLKRFYEVNYDKSDKTIDGNFLNSIVEIGTDRPIKDCMQ